MEISKDEFSQIVNSLYSSLEGKTAKDFGVEDGDEVPVQYILATSSKVANVETTRYFVVSMTVTFEGPESGYHIWNIHETDSDSYLDAYSN